MKAALEYYLRNVKHKGKRHTVRWILKCLRYNHLSSHYGPVMRVNRNDKTCIYALSGEYGDIVANHVKSLPAGATFIDIGTNYGLFSLLASSALGESGRVFSFEPNPYIYSAFLDNIRLNKARNIVPFHCAISSRTGLIGLSFDERHSGLSHLSDQGEVTVAAFNISDWGFLADELMDKEIHIKIDVEGYEAHILDIIGSAPWFANVRSVICEIDNQNLAKFGSDADRDIYERLEKLGFKATVEKSTRFQHYDQIFVR